MPEEKVMSIEQFFITAIIAALFGGSMCLIGSFLLKRINKYYEKATFKHKYLTPYKYEKKKETQ
jgi:hypothetical protein